MRSCKTSLFLAGALWAVVLGFSGAAWAGPSAVNSDTSEVSTVCLLDGNGDGTGTEGACQTGTGSLGDTANAGAGMGGVRLTRAHVAVTPIDKHWYCYYVDNYAAAEDYFVPFRTAEEWLKFLNNRPSPAWITPCARPDQSFSYGPNKLTNGDTSDEAETVSVGTLPYWRAGYPWPGTLRHPFQNHCYEENLVCEAGYNTCCVGGTDPDGSCPGGEHEDASCGCRAPLVCEKTWHNYTSTYGFFPSAGVSTGADNSGWSGYSSLVGQNRPAACNKRCTGDITTTPDCSIPDQTLYNAAVIFLCNGTGTSYGFNCQIAGVMTYIYLSQVNEEIAAYLASGQCAAAQAVQAEATAKVDEINNAGNAFFSQWCAAHNPSDPACAVYGN